MNTLQQGTVLHGSANTYTIEKELGQGSFGITYIASTSLKVQGLLGMLETDLYQHISKKGVTEFSVAPSFCCKYNKPIFFLNNSAV